jgi:DNA-binding LytR/AlgR family response regulator
MAKAVRGASAARDDLLFLSVAAASVAVVVTLNAFNTFHDRARVGQPVGFWEPFVWEGSSGLVVLAMTPLILAFVRRVWPLDPPIWRKVALHVAGAIVFSLIHVAAMGAARAAIYALADARYDPLGPLGDWGYELRKDLIVYAALVSLYVLWRLLRARSAAGPAAGVEILEVRDGARRHFVPLADVQWVEAAGNYVELHRGGAPVLHRASLSEMERRLSAAGFVRIHRSRLVRRDAIAAVESKPAGDFVVRLRDGPELAGSRRYRRPLLAD